MEFFMTNLTTLTLRVCGSDEAAQNETTDSTLNLPHAMHPERNMRRYDFGAQHEDYLSAA
jgi:hypothetical protein